MRIKGQKWISLLLVFTFLFGLVGLGSFPAVSYAEGNIHVTIRVEGPDYTILPETVVEVPAGVGNADVLQAAGLEVTEDGGLIDAIEGVDGDFYWSLNPFITAFKEGDSVVYAGNGSNTLTQIAAPEQVKAGDNFTVTVTKKDESAVSGAEVIYYPDGGHRTPTKTGIKTDANGQAALSIAEPGAYYVAAEGSNIVRTKAKAIQVTTVIDKTELNSLIAEAEQLKSGDYTAESWADFIEVLQAAQTVSAKEDATQTEVDNASAALLFAKDKLAVEAARIAIAGITYTVFMGSANTEDSVKEWIESEIAKLNLNGVTATVVMDSFTPAATAAETDPGTEGSFTFTVNLSKGEGETPAADSLQLSGKIAFTAGEGLYTYEVTNGEATITKCDSSAGGAIEIPATLGGYPVTGIGYRAFYYLDSLTSVTIPDSVTSIGEDAFRFCGSLTSLNIPNSVTSIGNGAFYSCGSLTTVAIPDGVTNIGDNVFNYCDGLTSVTIPDSVTSIGKGAFSGCDALTSVTIPDSVTSIGDSAFNGCGLTSLTIPSSVTSIGNGAFNYCAGLMSVTIPDSVTSIGDSVFANCAGLTSVTIPGSVTSVGKGAFRDCDGLTSVTIPDSVTSIGSRAFTGCETLASVTIGNGVTSVGDSAFRDCDSLTSVTIGNSVASILDWAFAGGDSLTSVTIPRSVTSIGAGAFWDCDSLTAIAVDADNPSYSSADGVLVSKDKSELIQYPGGKAGAYTIPGSVTSVGKGAFRDSDGLTSVTIPGSVTSIGEDAFGGCANLTSVTMGNGVTSIGNGAFAKCAELTSVTIPDSVTSMGDSAFSYCASLASATIGNGVTSIGDGAFAYCDVLESVTIPGSVTSIGGQAFFSCTTLTSLAIPDSVTSIEDRAFSGCTTLTSLTIPSSVTSIGYGAFWNCSGLTSITIAGSVTSIEDRTFYGCGSLTSLTIPDSVTSIGKWAFNGCGSLTSVSIPQSVTSIGSGVFSGCSNLSIYGVTGSYAETYASDNDIPFVAVDKTQLKALLAEAEQLESGDYTAESWAGFTEVLQAAQAVSAKADAAQTEVDNASAALSAAKEQLVIFDGEVNRIAGGNRYDTSAQTALNAYPDGAETVIIARGDDEGNFADALAASYLAGVKNAPILLTSPGSLPQEIEAAVKQLGAQKAYVLGGELAVSQGVADKLKSLGLQVERITGNDRYATAAAIAAKGGPADTAIVVSGFAPADSLVAGSLAFSENYPILLVDKNSVPAETKKAVAELSIEKIIVIGGENAVSKAVYSELKAKERYAGQSRIETSLDVAKKLFATATDFSIVGYLKLADAVGAAVNGNPIIYVKDNISDVEGYLTGAAAPNSRFTIFGGVLAVNNTVENELKELLQ